MGKCHKRYLYARHASAPGMKARFLTAQGWFATSRGALITLFALFTLLRAAASLGAAPSLAFRKITLPLIAPGVISGALFAFVTSWDEVVVALFLASPEQRTLPRQMFSGIREQISPTITAAATFLVVLATLLMMTLELLRRRSERLQRAP